MAEVDNRVGFSEEHLVRPGREESDPRACLDRVRSLQVNRARSTHTYLHIWKLQSAGDIEPNQLRLDICISLESHQLSS